MLAFTVHASYTDFLWFILKEKKSTVTAVIKRKYIPLRARHVISPDSYIMCNSI